MRFGTDGIRGPAEQPPIDADGARRVGAAAARWALAQGEPAPTVYVARDTRPSGPALAAAVLEGVAGAGVRAVDLGVLPTSALQTVLADALIGGRVATGVMVTASHNPAPDNGFKVLGLGGFKPDDADTARLEAWLADPPPRADDEPVDGRETALDTYARGFAGAVRGVPSLRGRRVAVDLARGAALAARDVLAPLLHGVEVVWTGDDEGDINDGVGSEHPGHLAEVVRREGCAAGLAVDGDGDRCLLVDERGEVVPGDAVTWLLARGLRLERIAVTVMSTGALEAALPGVEVTRTAVGDRHLAAAMRAGQLPLGAEESGHVLFADGLPGGDGLVTGLRALEVAFRQHDRLSGALADFPRWPRRLTRVRVRARPPLDQVPAVEAARVRGEAALGQGRVFLRYSGTEPVLRVLVEGRDAARVDEVSREVTAACHEALG